MTKLPKDVELLFKKLYKNKTIKSVKPGPTGIRLGFPVMFLYDAKTKNKLPYWDRLPFSIIIGKLADGFLGLNLHYLPWTLRLQLSKKLVMMAKNKKRMTYQQIKKAWSSLKLPEAWLMLTIRRYLYSHIRSDIKVFTPDDYREAIKDISPKFVKDSEMGVLNAIRALMADRKKMSK